MEDDVREKDIAAGESQQKIAAALSANQPTEYETKVDELAEQAAAQLHKKLPNADNEPIELKVEHKIEVTEVHVLVGKCDACGDEIKTNHPMAIKSYEEGKTANSHCKCGQRFVVHGKSKLVKPSDMGRVVVPGKANNRHARRLHAVKGKG